MLALELRFRVRSIIRVSFDIICFSIIFYSIILIDIVGVCGLVVLYSYSGSNIEC